MGGGNAIGMRYARSPEFALPVDTIRGTFRDSPPRETNVIRIAIPRRQGFECVKPKPLPGLIAHGRHGLIGQGKACRS